MDCTRNYVDRKFGHCVIKWKIRNYCISPCELDWTIFSPDFYIRMAESTKWRMMLKRSKVSDKESSTSFELKRLEHNRISPYVWTDCKLYFCDRFGKHILKDFEHRFAADSKYKMELKNTSLTPINNFHSGVFTLRLEILAQFDHVEETISTCCDLGIKKLSEDLRVLYETSEHSDIHLKVGDECIEGHKAILYHRVRSPNLKESISDDGVIILEDFENYAAWNKVIQYLYTANMEHVVTEPSINTYESAVSFGVEPIILYYAPDELTLYTTTEVEEFFLTWTIQNIFTRRERYLLSPIVTGTMGTSFRLKLYPKGFGNKQEFMGAFVEIEGGIAKDVCVQFSLRDTKEEINFERIHKRIVGKEVFGNKKVEKLEILEEFLENESLTIGFHLRMPTGAQNNSIGTSITTCKPYSEQLNYIQLSEDMLSLYRSSKFHDFKLFLQGRKSKIRVHRCLLSIRCRTLLDIMMVRNQNNIHSFKYSTIRKLLHFLYCGKFDDHVPITNFSELYRCAKAFNVSTLKYALVDNLQKNLTQMNATAVYEFADSENIETLRTFVEKFLEEIK